MPIRFVGIRPWQDSTTIDIIRWWLLAYTNTSPGERSVGVLGLVTKRDGKEEISSLVLAGKMKGSRPYNGTPGLDPSEIGPTIGQNMGKVSLPWTILSFFDLGGQRGMRLIWHRYYDECHTVVYMKDGKRLTRPFLCLEFSTSRSSSRTNGIHPSSMSATEIREDYEVWDHYRCDSARRQYVAEEEECKPRGAGRVGIGRGLGDRVTRQGQAGGQGDYQTTF
ncbi:hypothetical protein EV363DRAFT_1548479 [Boletus edulis]|nr:hypothetical protein EV363DRAFT_1548479 [Boletus edulis]